MNKIVITGIALAAGIALGWGVASLRARSTAGDPSAHATHAASAAPAAPAGPASAGSAAERRVLYWYDPMSPAAKFDHPGKSPFMDMDLVPRYAEDGAGEGGAGLAVSTAARQALGLRLADVDERAIGQTVHAVGTLQLNEREVAIVQARSAGFVERVPRIAPGDVIAAGALLAEVMNPDWLGAEQEYLAVKATGDAALTAAARTRLQLLGIPETTIAAVERSGHVAATQRVISPIAGVVTELAVRNGMTLAPGMTLARINGLGTLWLEAAVPDAQAAAVRPGMPVQARFAAWPGEAVAGRVAAILPEAQRDSRTLRLRIELPNPHQRLQAGLYCEVTLQGPQLQALTVPSEAVIRTGRRALVYLALPQGRYEPVEVEVGDEIGDRIVVRSGLAAGQRVVASGQFLLDSEASLRGIVARSPAGAAASEPAR
ncbi:MAG: efflux RND transporter periplasmic adaptor subunit [Burkholderiales bacterium]|nr:efflux RND transporter periplasmic adaptor subunit [Burkholderiales bacterium]